VLRYGYRSNWFGEGQVVTRPSLVAEKLLGALEEARKVRKGREGQEGCVRVIMKDWGRDNPPPDFVLGLPQTSPHLHRAQFRRSGRSEGTRTSLRPPRPLGLDQFPPHGARVLRHAVPGRAQLALARRNPAVGGRKHRSARPCRERAHHAGR